VKTQPLAAVGKGIPGKGIPNHLVTAVVRPLDTEKTLQWVREFYQSIASGSEPGESGGQEPGWRYVLTSLPTLAEIEAAEKATQGKDQ
jgi:hypothetical protein